MGFQTHPKEVNSLKHEEVSGLAVTILDLARIAGVSHSTVSRALNGSSLVSAKTRTLIEKLAKEHGYTPNLSARGLKKERSYTLLLLMHEAVDMMPSSFIYEILDGIFHAVDKEYIVAFKKLADPASVTDLAINGKYDGIFGLCVSDDDLSSFRRMADVNAAIPIVIMNCNCSGEFPCVYFNENEGAYLAVRHLMGLGHRRIALIEGPGAVSSTRTRRAGYLRALNTGDIAIDQTIMVSDDFSVEGGIRSMSKLLRLNSRPTAVFASNDLMAVGALYGCQNGGLRVPDDMALIGFDNMEITSYTNPPISTMKKSKHELGAVSARLMLELIEHGAQTKEIVLEVEPVIRET